LKFPAIEDAQEPGLRLGVRRTNRRWTPACHRSCGLL